MNKKVLYFALFFLVAMAMISRVRFLENGNDDYLTRTSVFSMPNMPHSVEFKVYNLDSGDMYYSAQHLSNYGTYGNILPIGATEGDVAKIVVSCNGHRDVLYRYVI